MMNEYNHRIPVITADIIEKHYYRDINLPHFWDSLIKETLTSEKTIQSQIENAALIGLQNIREFIAYAVHRFERYDKIWFKNNDAQRFIKNYFCVLCYLANINDYSHFYNKPAGDIAVFEAITNSLIEHQFLFANPSENNFSRVFEIITLPFIFNQFIELLDALDKDNAKSILDEKLQLFFAKSNLSKNSFDYLLNDENKQYLNMVLSIINIFYFFKRIYFFSGTRKTYGYYQRVLDKESGNAFYSISYEKKMYLLRGSSALFAGEANIDHIHLLPNKNIFIEFRASSFLDSDSTARAALNSALSINEHFSDCIVSKTTQELPLFPYTLLLEDHGDNPQFTTQVHEQLAFLNPEYHDCIKIIPNLKIASSFEKERYLLNIAASIPEQLQQNINHEISKLTQKPTFELTNRAFENVRLIKLNIDEVLVKEGDPALFVYLPLSEGLEGNTKNQFKFFPQPWLPIGHIGVIQKGFRTATIVAKQPVELLMIPGVVYTTYWHIYYTEEELKQILAPQ